MKTWSKLIAMTMAGCLSALVAGVPAQAAEITVVAGGGPLPDVFGTPRRLFPRPRRPQARGHALPDAAEKEEPLSGIASPVLLVESEAPPHPAPAKLAFAR